MEESRTPSRPVVPADAESSKENKEDEDMSAEPRGLRVLAAFTVRGDIGWTGAGSPGVARERGSFRSTWEVHQRSAASA
jgi:hypothetical protein